MSRANLSLLPGLTAERQRMFDARMAQLNNGGPAPHVGKVCNSNTDGSYQGTELKPYDGRPHAMDAFDKPSLFMGVLHYRDGRKVALATKAQPVVKQSLKDTDWSAA